MVMYLGTQDGGPSTNHTDGTGQRDQSFLGQITTLANQTYQKIGSGNINCITKICGLYAYRDMNRQRYTGHSIVPKYITILTY